MRRFAVLAALALGAAAIAWCHSARAQQRALPLVAFLSPRTSEANIDAFRRGLRDLGYVEGRSVETDTFMPTVNLSAFPN